MLLGLRATGTAFVIRIFGAFCGFGIFRGFGFLALLAAEKNTTRPRHTIASGM